MVRGLLATAVLFALCSAAPLDARAEGDPKDAGVAPPPTAERTYEKPTPRALPEGPATVLAGPIVVVRFDAMVNPGMAEHVADALERAQKEEAQLLLIELDTPGGLVTSTEKIVQSLLSARLPVVVHVTPSGAHAASAGTFIALSAHIAAMSPATRIGAAHPVTGTGQDPEKEGGKHLAAKVENDLVALAKGIAGERNRNVEWAIAAVRESVSADAEEALEIGVIDLIARDRTELFEKLDGLELALNGKRVKLSPRGARVVEHEPSLRNEVLNLLANPGIAILLGVLGLIGIMVEIYHPGLIAPGVMGVLCILVSLIAMEQLPINVGAALLVVAGIGLLIAEIYTPTFGTLGILGAIGLTVGLLLLVDPSDPEHLVDPSFGLGLLDVLPAVLLFAGFVAYLSYFVIRKKRGRSLTGAESLLGTRGRVLRPVGPGGGQVFVSGEYWQATAAEDIGVGEEVEVVKVEGLRLEVRRKGAGP